MRNNLVIGDTSQISYYFPENFVKISSRNIDYNNLTKFEWDRIFVCVGESRKFIQNSEIYNQVNYELVLSIIKRFKGCSNKIIIYSTCELWNKCDGPISIDMDFDFYETPYLLSKYKITKKIIENPSEFSNVILIYPFNFNSPYRTNEFLFGKIFSSLIERKTIEIGDTYFYRDLIHPKFLVNESINSQNHKIVGSGRMVYINDFIRDLYSNFDINYDEYVV